MSVLFLSLLCSASPQAPHKILLSLSSHLSNHLSLPSVHLQENETKASESGDPSKSCNSVLICVAMNHHRCFLMLIILITLLQLSTSPHSTFFAKGIEMEEKTRVGSTPPTCHSKCNECRPCFAVQVPTIQSIDRVVNLRPSSTKPPYLKDSYDLPGNRYSPYKPLGWKCRCNNHFYNP